MNITWIDSRGVQHVSPQLGKTFRAEALDRAGKRWDYVTVWSPNEHKPIVLHLLDRAGNADTIFAY